MILLSTIILSAALNPPVDIDASNWQGAAYALRDRIDGASADRLKQLEQSPDPTTSLAAAWALSWKGSDYPPPLYWQRDPSKKFLQFFKMRTGVTPPETPYSAPKGGGLFPEWRRYREPGKVITLVDGGTFTVFDHELPFSPAIKVFAVMDGKIWTVNEKFHDFQSSPALVVLKGKRRFEIPVDPEHSFKDLSFSFDSKNAILAPYSLYDESFNLYCFKANGHLAWKQLVWTGGRSYFWGFAIPNLIIKRQGDSVTVFDDWSGDAYAESFRISDGKPLFRFSTNYWGIAPRPEPDPYKNWPCVPGT